MKLTILFKFSSEYIFIPRPPFSTIVITVSTLFICIPRGPPQSMFNKTIGPDQSHAAFTALLWSVYLPKLPSKSISTLPTVAVLAFDVVAANDDKCPPEFYRISVSDKQNKAIT